MECVSAFEGKRMGVSCAVGLVRTSTGLYNFSGWKKLRLQMADEERAYEQVAKDDDRRWLCERRMVSLP